MHLKAKGLAGDTLWHGRLAHESRAGCPCHAQSTILRLSVLLAVGALGGMALPGTAAAYSPTNVTGLTIWVDASDVNNTGSNPANGAAVATWVNKVGAFNATQGNSSLRPVMASGVLNDLDVIHFTRPAYNSARYLEFNNTAVATLLDKTNTTIVVARANNGGGDNSTQKSMYLFARPGWHSGMTLVGNPSATSAGTTRWLGSKAANIGQSLPYTQGQFEVITRTVKGTTAAAPSSLQLFLVYTNQPAITNTTYALWNHSPNQNILRLGCAHVSGDYTGGLDGDIAEMLFYNRELSTEERQELEGYLSWKWGLEDSLPAGHPYEHAAPGVDLAIPIIANQPVSAITDTSATFNGWLISTGTSATAVSVYWGAEDGELSGTWSYTNEWDAGVWGTNSYPSTNIVGLTQNTTYFYTFGANNAATNTVATPRIAFKTLGPPAVDNGTGATSVGVSTVTLNGTLTDGAPANVFFDWWADGADVTNRVDLGAPRELGGFSANLSGLTPSATYHYQAYVSNTYGTATAATTNFTTLASVTTNGNVTWSGVGAVPFWDVPANWVGTAAPTNPTAATVTFGINGTAVMSVVDVDRQVGGITFGGAQYDPAITHTIDLSGKTLTVAGTIARTRFETQTLNVTDGTLRIGTASSAGNINLGQDYGAGTLTIRPGAVLDTFNLNSITLGYTQWGPNGRGYLDLRGAKVAGGVLATTNLYLRMGSSQNSRLYLDQDTEIDRIRIARNLEICRTSGPGSGYIGNPTDERLPSNISFNVGVGPSERGNITISQISFVGYGNVNGKLVASGGGTFEGWLNEMHIVRYEAGSANGDNRTGNAHIGTFDISRMNACLIDVNMLRVGTDHYVHPPLSQDNLQATMALCPGVVTANVAVVGSTIGSGWGRVSLSNTLFRVHDTFTLNRTGEVTIRLGAEPIGLDVDGTFIDQSAGTIAVHFLAEPAANTTNWAIRVKGDAVATLAAMVGSSPSRLTSTGTFTGKRVGILYDGAYTYYAMVDESVPFPPIAVAHATRTYELASGGTVNISTNDINNGSSDPGGRPFALSISSDGVNFSPTLSFSATGTYTVTLKITAGSDESTATCEVSIVDLHTGTAGVNRTWRGAAPTVLMDRREWMWSDNWVEGTPPANPTTGTIQFRDSGQSVVGLLEADRTVGGLTLGQSGITVNHTLNLGNRVLTVAGNITNPGRGTFVVTNGTLRVGTDASAGNTTVGLGTTLRISPQATLNTRNLNGLQVGSASWDGATAVLNLRGATLTDGRLATTNLTVNFGSGHGRIELDGQTGLTEIHAYSSLIIGDTPGGGGTCYIGNPNDSMRLPPNISLKIGVNDTHRAVMRILSVNTYGYGNDNARLVASSGGTFTAWLSSLTVMLHQIQTSQRTGNAHYGTLDLSRMDACAIDTLALRIANDHADPSATDNLRGVVRLPPGTLKAGTAVIGATLGQGYGQLHLSNTVCQVTGAMTNRNTGQITVNIGSTPSGLQFVSSDANAYVAETLSKLTLRFLADPVAKPHYGLSWAGDHVETLTDMRDDGRLAIEDAALSEPAVIFKSGGNTYVGIPPPGGTLFLLR